MVGVCALVAKISFLSNIVTEEKIGATGYAFVVNKAGIVIAHPNADFILTLNTLQTDGMKDFAKEMVAGKRGVASYVLNGVHRTAGFSPVASTGWSTVMSMADSDSTFRAVAKDLQSTLLIISAIAIVVAFLIYVFFSRSITTPLHRGVAFAQKVAAGDFTEQLAIRQRDEVGILAEALNAMSEKLRDMVASDPGNAEQVAAVQRGDLRERPVACRGRAEPGLHAGADQRFG